MKNTVLIAAGALLLLIAALVPLPPVAAVPGIAVRIILALLGCGLIVCVLTQSAYSKRNGKDR